MALRRPERSLPVRNSRTPYELSYVLVGAGVSHQVGSGAFDQIAYSDWMSTPSGKKEPLEKPANHVNIHEAIEMCHLTARDSNQCIQYIV